MDSTLTDGEWGPWGQDQIVNGYVAEWRGDLNLKVVDSSSPPQEKTTIAVLEIDWTYPYNPSCEA